MDAIEALHTRNSVALLTEPAPNSEQLDQIIRAGLRANDHGRLRPWRFIVIKGDARHGLGEVLKEIKRTSQPDATEKELEQAARAPLRAPLIVVVVAKVQEHDRIPEIEQILATAGAAQLMMVAAHALEVGAIWRTGAPAYHPLLKRSFGLEQTDHICGLLYMGTPKVRKPLEALEPEAFTQHWPGVMPD
ncbi:nitroreductase [Pseudomaricurvus alkylphenolicus]|jgi:nitroreductase|uniref:nitroreductase family protein n=1 Tax=Pseudomaricurvus alkylphenolicus TaxID=1306991 RepID=UPI00141F9A95|nr:nitroreductase family protein [Pseudomaricurvus alkylphenolicus]NIB42144.1 nitroreductase [Pseudomaricurvus alkylphenolicus]